MLRTHDVASDTRWRWVLTDDAGVAVLDHDVELDGASWQYEAFRDLYRWVHEPQDTPAAKLVADIGDWIRAEVLGPAIAERVSGSTVRVRLEQDSAFLYGLPLELPFAATESYTTFVYELDDGTSGGPAAKTPVTDELRILGLFSTPRAGTLLQFRRERYELAQHLQRIGGKLRVDLRIMQYGVTRESLQEAVEEYESWDVLHLCCGGTMPGFWLEGPDGRPERLTLEELIAVLRPARKRLKLVVLSAYRSGADAVAALHTIGLDAVAADLTLELDARPDDGAFPIRELIHGLVRELDVAVLAMRYPVVDDFAITFARDFYSSVLTSKNPVTRAVALKLPKYLAGPPSLLRPPLSVSTPALFGRTAVDLFLKPSGRPLKPLPEYPFVQPEATALVGHVDALANANFSLTPDSGVAGVLLIGPAGVGKTTCALELAYERRERFSKVMWWCALGNPAELAAMRASLTAALVEQLDLHHPDDEAPDFDRIVGRVQHLLQTETYLIALDGVEALLTDAGDWRDEKIQRLVGVLTGIGGRSRTILTSRVLPTAAVTALHHEDVGPLRDEDAVMLCCEKPCLGELLHSPDGAPDAEASRAFARGVLKAAGGSPRLLALAEQVIGFARRSAVDAGGAAVGPFGPQRAAVVEALARSASGADEAETGLLSEILGSPLGGPLWMEVAPVLARVVAGERGEALMVALGAPAAALVGEVLAASAGPCPVNAADGPVS